MSISLFLWLLGWFRAKWNAQKLKHVHGILMFPSWKYDFFIVLVNILKLNQPIANESILATMYIIVSTDNNWCLTQNWFGSKKLFVGNLFWGYLEIVSLGNFFLTWKTNLKKFDHKKLNLKKNKNKKWLKRQWHRSGFAIVNFEHIPHLVLVFILLTLNM